jgi:hypothetical protein
VTKHVAGCFAYLVLWALLGAGSYRLMTPAVPMELRPWLALVSALFLTVGLLSFWHLARGFGQGDASRAAVLRRAAAGERPPAGGPVVASGFVRALGAPLVAPLSGVECVGYIYRMYYLGRRRGHAPDSNRPVEVPVYWGHAAQPFAIESPATRFRVLAVPMLLDTPFPREGADMVERARQLVAVTQFEQITTGVLGAAGTALQLANTMFNDDDGEARRDWMAAEEARDPQTLRLEETVLPVGHLASVAGTWSPERQAIVAGGEGSGGPGVSAILGTPEKLADHAGALPLHASVTAYLITAIALTATGVGLVWFSIVVLPGLL